MKLKATSPITTDFKSTSSISASLLPVSPSPATLQDNGVYFVVPQNEQRRVTLSVYSAGRSSGSSLGSANFLSLGRDLVIYLTNKTLNDSYYQTRMSKTGRWNKKGLESLGNEAHLWIHFKLMGADKLLRYSEPRQWKCIGCWRTE